MTAPHVRSHSSLSRRALLAGATGCALATLLNRSTSAAAATARDIKLSAAPGRWPIVGKPYPPTDVWCYGDRIPGPEFRVSQGERVRIVFQNNLPEDTTVHWHGIR